MNDLKNAVTSQPPVTRRKWVNSAVWVGLPVIIALLPLLITSPFKLHIVILAFIWILASASLRMIILTGQFPMAHAGLMGVGGYAAGLTAKWLGWPPWFTIALGAIAAGGLGMLTAVPFSRLRAIYYALGSLFFGLVLVSLFSSTDWTGKTTGLHSIPALFAGASKLPSYYLILGVTLVCLIILYKIEFSRIGLNWKAIDQSYLAVSSVGINERWNRILAVGVGSFFVGLAGALYVLYNGVTAPVNFGLTPLLLIVMYAMVGGMKNFAGPIIGALILYLIPQIFFRSLGTYSPYVSAVLLLIFCYLMPDGLIGVPNKIKSWYTQRKNRTNSGTATEGST
jgi:branched-chain amino acid transport system permease protein